MKEKKYKMWIFYLINKDEVYGTSEYDIYAFTDKIEFVESFIQTRNMNKFFTKKIKMNQSEYNDLIKNYMNSELDMFEGTTKIKSSNDVKTFSLVLTRREKMTVTNMSSLCLNEYIYREVWVDPNIFKKKYISALSILQYTGLHQYLSSSGDDDIWEDTVKNLFSNDLNILLKDFRCLFIEEGCDDIDDS